MKTILVVDDEFDLTSTLKAILEHQGYGIEICSNGREAIDCIRENHPDLIVMDVMMPLGNGYEVLEKIRATSEFEETPVVMMNSVQPPAGRAVQWQAFLKKPFSVGPLLETVESLIGPGVAAESH